MQKVPRTLSLSSKLHLIAALFGLLTAEIKFQADIASLEEKPFCEKTQKMGKIKDMQAFSVEIN